MPRRPSPRCAAGRTREDALRSSDKPGHRLRRNVTIGTRRTSVSLEDHVWDGLTDVCRREGLGIDALCTAVDRHRSRSTMSSALRVFLLLYYRRLAVGLEERAPGHDGGDQLQAALDRLREAERELAGG